MNWRMLGPVSVAQQTRTVSGGRTYTAVAGVALDVIDCDAAQLQSNGWVYVSPSGPTSARPVGSVGLYPAVAGAKFYDTTISSAIVFDGLTWRNSVGAAV
jgi:hypothetical protein